MRRILALSLAALATVSARPVLAEDGKTYTFPAGITWKAGDVATRVDTESMKQKVLVGGQVVQGGDTPVETKYEAVMSVKEVNEKGEYTKALVYLKTWSKGGAEGADDSLSGAHIEVNGAGASRTAKVLTPGMQPSPAALAWLDEKFGKGSADDDEGSEALLPKNPVAVGDTWEPDLAALRKNFAKNEMKFVDDKCTAKGTLVAVKDGVGELKFDISLQAAGMDTPGGHMEWAEGGAMVLTLVIHRPVDSKSPETQMTMSLKFGGAFGPPGAGAMGNLEVSVDGSMTAKMGGEMPPVPEAK